MSDMDSISLSTSQYYHDLIMYSNDYYNYIIISDIL